MADTQRGFNIGVFKAEMNSKKLLRPNIYHVEFSLPPGLQTGHSKFQTNIQTIRTLEYWCEATSLPGTAINTYQSQRYGYGPLEQRPVLPAYTEQQFMFIFDAETRNYDLFRDWMNTIINTNAEEGMNVESGEVVSQGRRTAMAPYELSYRDDYVADVSVIVYDSEGNPKKQCTLRDAFPKAVGDITLGWADNNSYMRLPVQFAYVDWFETRITNFANIPQQPIFV